MCKKGYVKKLDLMTFNPCNNANVDFALDKCRLCRPSLHTTYKQPLSTSKTINRAK